MKIGFAISPAALLAAMIGTASAQVAVETPPADILRTAQSAAGTMPSATGTAADQPASQYVVLPPSWAVKTKLTPEELKKFLDLAAFAHKGYDSIETISDNQSSRFSVQGKIQDDGSLVLYQLKVDYGGRFYLLIAPDGELSFCAYDRDDAPGPLLPLRSSQELLQRMIAIWMAYQLPQ